MSPKKPAAYENPLIPNARLQQMYRAILRAHLLGEALIPAQRLLTAGREAALVSTAIDLKARDLVLDGVSGPVVEFLRGTPLHRALRPGAKSSTRTLADAGSASRLASFLVPEARIHAAIGAASAVQSAAVVSKKNAKESDPNAHDSAVVVAYALPGEITEQTWKAALAHAAQHDLPAVFVLLPLPSSARPNSGASRSTGIRAIAHRAGVPAIPVDAADPVAIYRVAQESIGHARIGGGPALIECVAFPAAASRRPVAMKHLEQYMLARNIATRGWMEREAAAFSARLQALKFARK